MRPAQITWYVIQNNMNEIVDGEHYVGSYDATDEKIKIKVQVWNNKWGQENVESIMQSNVVVSFGTYEDSKLLESMSVHLDNSSSQDTINIIENKAYIPLKKSLLGTANNGSDSDMQNYSTVELVFDIKDKALKTGLKHLYLDLQFTK